MGFQNETEVLLLVPNMDSTVGTTGVADTIFVESGAGELGLGEFRSKSTVLEELLAGVGWVPELEGSRGNSDKFEVIWLLGPLDVVNGI